MQKLLRTTPDFTLTVARVVLAIIFFAHGSQKAFGWFGGPGFDNAIAIFQTTMGIPAPLTVFVMFTELSASIGLLLGLLTRVAALGLLGLMIVAPFANGLYPQFFMNWTGKFPHEGFEYHLLAAALIVGLLVRGAGAWSLDHALMSNRR
ncbi:MAG: DoxX family protein [Acidobacteriota bacterium]